MSSDKASMFNCATALMDSLHTKLDSATTEAMVRDRKDGEFYTNKRANKKGETEDVKVYIPTKKEAEESSGGKKT